MTVLWQQGHRLHVTPAKYGVGGALVSLAKPKYAP
jgi:hypothetical protein